MNFGQKRYGNDRKWPGLAPIGSGRMPVENPGFKPKPVYRTMNDSGQQEQEVPEIQEPEVPEVQQPEVPEVQQPAEPAPGVDYGQQLDELYEQIMNRQPFQFDLNEDALYQQLKDSYIQSGRLAMMDTMGQAATLTGGYGNSYAQGVGQQAYQQYLQGLTDEIPDLYAMALNRYMAEGDALYDQLGALQWKAEFDEDQRRYDQAWEQEYGSGDSDGSGGGSDGSGGSGSNGGYGGYSQETADIQQMLRDAGYDIAVDGIWGPETQAAYDEYMNGGSDGTEYTDENGASRLSDAAQAFVDSLPYPGGGHSDGWKDMVRSRLDSSGLSDEDKIAVAVVLGLY